MMKKVGLGPKYFRKLLTSCSQRYDEAATTLSRVRKLPIDHEYVQWELLQTREQLDIEERVRGNASILDLVKELFTSRDHGKRMGLGLALLVRILLHSRRP